MYSSESMLREAIAIVKSVPLEESIRLLFECLVNALMADLNISWGSGGNFPSPFDPFLTIPLCDSNINA